MTTEPIKVLDHGLVRLVDHMGDDMTIVRSARVSYNAEPREDGSDARLINYLMKNRHTSPFEHVNFLFEIKAPIFVFRQWHRHRTWSYNEVSARYTELPEEYYSPKPEHVTTQHVSNKQMRTTVQHDRASSWIQILRMHNHVSFDLYQSMLKDGVPRELARTVLPLSTYSHMFASTDLHNLFHFLKLRLHEHAQYEIMVYAKAMLELIEPIVPIAVAAFKEHQLGDTGLHSGVV